jgi:hypothetical protein
MSLPGYFSLYMNKIKCIWPKGIIAISLLLLSESFNSCIGQQINFSEKNKNISTLADNVRDLFYSSNCSYGPLVNGKIYTDYYPRLLGHQFLASKGWEKGMVYFRNDVQKELLINYDIVSDKLVANEFYPEGPRYIELNINDVEGFYINGHRFIKAPASDSSKDKSGYYELLYNGRALLLMRWEKYISKSSDPDKDVAYTENTIYIRTNGKIVRINNRKTLISCLSDKGEDIENYLRRRKFFVRTAGPDDFVELLRYYDNL